MAIREGNVFVARDSAYPRCHGEKGFLALVFGTADAEAPTIAGSAMGHFGRKDAGVFAAFRRCDREDGHRFLQARFRRGTGRGRNFLFRMRAGNAPKVDRSGLERHANGVSGLKGVVLVAENTAAHREFLQIAHRRRCHDRGRFRVSRSMPDNRHRSGGRSRNSKGALRHRGDWKPYASALRRDLWRDHARTDGNSFSGRMRSPTRSATAGSSCRPHRDRAPLSFSRLQHEQTEPLRRCRRRQLRQRRAVGADRRPLPAGIAPACFRHGRGVEGVDEKARHRTGLQDQLRQGEPHIAFRQAGRRA